MGKKRVSFRGVEAQKAARWRIAPALDEAVEGALRTYRSRGLPYQWGAYHRNTESGPWRRLKAGLSASQRWALILGSDKAPQVRQLPDVGRVSCLEDEVVLKAADVLEAAAFLKSHVRGAGELESPEMGAAFMAGFIMGAASSDFLPDP